MVTATIPISAPRLENTRSNTGSTWVISSTVTAAITPSSTAGTVIALRTSAFRRR